ncbi:hypothetical protein ACOVWF_005367, partial [Escherichia coli]
MNIWVFSIIKGDSLFLYHSVHSPFPNKQPCLYSPGYAVPCISASLKNYIPSQSFVLHLTKDKSMHTPYPFNPRYTMNWFLLSLLNDHLNQLLNRYSRIQALRLDLFYQKGTERFKRHSWNETE